MEGERNLKLIYVRRLFATDISAHYARLVIPYDKVMEEFLTPAEELMLVEGNKIEVAVIDPSMTKQTMCLSNWKISSDWCYVLTCGWNKLVQRNQLVKGDVIHVSSFRSDGKLGFLIHKTASAPVEDW